MQAGANAVWRKILEERAEAESAAYQEGVSSLVTPRAYLEVMLAKSFAGLVDDSAEVSVDQGLAAARELGKLTPQGDDELKWARTQAQLNRVIAVMRELPPDYQEMVLAKLEGRPCPPPTGGGRLAQIEGGLADDEEFDPGDDEDFDEED